MLTASLDLDEFTRQFSQAATATVRAAGETAIRKAAENLRGRTQEQFLTEGTAYGNRWTPRKKQNPWPLLNRTGRLLLSFVEPGNPEHIEEFDFTDPSRPSLLFGSRVPYADAHQRGTKFLPARPILTAALLGGDAKGDG